MNKNELTDILEESGLSPYQAEAYVTVLELGSAAATEIANASDVPDPRIYDVLRDLEKMGYIETYEQDSLHAHALRPEEMSADLRTRAERFESAADEVERRWEEPSMDSHSVSFVKRIDTVLDRAEEMIRNADNQVQLSVNLQQYARLRDALQTAHDNDVHVRLAIYIDEQTDPPTDTELSDIATEARYRTFPLSFMALIDRKRTCYAPQERSNHRYGIIVEDQAHAYIFHWFFMAALWQSTDHLYTQREDGLPRTYVDIRKCIRDVGPLLEEGATVHATVDVREVDGTSDRTLSGRIVDVRYPHADVSTEDIPLLYLGGQAYVVLDTGEETIEIGGWGAIIEEFEATRIVVESVDGD